VPDQGIPDPEFERVFSTLAGRPDFVGEVGSAIRQGIDDVLDGARTGRFDLFGTDVNKNERTHVGTRIEILVISSLGVKRGRHSTWSWLASKSTSRRPSVAAG